MIHKWLSSQTSKHFTPIIMHIITTIKTSNRYSDMSFILSLSEISFLWVFLFTSPIFHFDWRFQCLYIINSIMQKFDEIFCEIKSYKITQNSFIPNVLKCSVYATDAIKAEFNWCSSVIVRNVMRIWDGHYTCSVPIFVLLCFFCKWAYSITINPCDMFNFDYEYSRLEI